MKRDPVLVMRAQRAAAALEQAWDRWRKLHGLGPEPLPQLSSYVGYSFEEPYGQPRVVLGVAAEEAEHLTALLQGHQCIGPADTEVRPAVRQNGAPRQAGGTGELPNRGGRVRLPPQPVAGAERPSERHALPGATGAALPSDSALGQVSPLDGGRRQPPLGPRDGGISFGQAATDVPATDFRTGPTSPPGPVPPLGGVSPQLSSTPRHILQAPVLQPPAAPSAAESHTVRLIPDAQAVAAADSGQSGLVAFRPHPAPEPYLEQTQASELSGQADEPDEADPQARGNGQATSRRGHREHAAERHPMPWLPRQKRSAPQPAREASAPSPAPAPGSNGRQQDGKDRKSLTSMAAELPGWAVTELPGQLFHRRQTNGRAPDSGAGAAGDAGDGDDTGWPGHDQVL